MDTEIKVPNSIAKLKNRAYSEWEASKRINTNFIYKSYPSTILTNMANDIIINAVIVSLHDKDMAYVYIEKEEVVATIQVGSVWNDLVNNWLFYEYVDVIKDVGWHKFKAFRCNVHVEEHYGLFIGPEKRYVNISNEDGASLESLQKPILILPTGALNFRDKVVIYGRPWLVQEWDAISSPGVVYYSLRPTTVSKDIIAAQQGNKVLVEKYVDKTEDLILEPTSVDEDKIAINANMQITLSTEDGYFRSSRKEVKVLKLSETSVTFLIPFGVSEAIIETKEGGQVVTHDYVTN